MAQAEMTSRERVQAALAGEPVDRPPVSLWQHFPNRDQDAEQLATSTIWWQGLLDLDFIKLMPPGDYATIDWGLESEYRGATGGTRDTTRYPIWDLDDWGVITPLDLNYGMLADVIGACSRVSEAVGPDVPVLQTIFSPLTIAGKLSDGRVIQHLREHPDRIHSTLEIIRDVTINVTKASLAAGASGIFFASQYATSEEMTQNEYVEFGEHYDRAVLTAAADSEFTMIHIHGRDTYFDLMAAYPGHALNWHDRRVGPPLSEALEKYPQRAAVGGIDEQGVADMTPEQVATQVGSARRATGDRRLLVGPGCVISVKTPIENLQAAVAAAKVVGTPE